MTLITDPGKLDATLHASDGWFSSYDDRPPLIWTTGECAMQIVAPEPSHGTDWESLAEIWFEDPHHADRIASIRETSGKLGITDPTPVDLLWEADDVNYNRGEFANDLGGFDDWWYEANLGKDWMMSNGHHRMIVSKLDSIPLPIIPTGYHQ